jgi:hypothetical protein
MVCDRREGKAPLLIKTGIGGEDSAGYFSRYRLYRGVGRVGTSRGGGGGKYYSLGRYLSLIGFDSRRAFTRPFLGIKVYTYTPISSWLLILRS